LAAQEQSHLLQVLLSLDRKIWGIAYSYSKNAEDARDIAQEVRLRIIEKGESYRGGASLETWMYRIAVNVCRDHARSGARKRKREVPMEEDVEAPSEDREALFALRTALEGLPARQRQLLSLREFGGLSYKEVAGVLGLSLGSVESGLFDTRTRLAKILDRVREGEK